MIKFKLGFLINPIAGIGGSVALKGSDGVAEQALKLGAKPLAHLRAAQALEVLIPYREKIVIYTAGETMGEHCARQLGFHVQVVYRSANANTDAKDTEQAVAAIQNEGIDLLLFAGGDGTARDVCRIVAEQLPVLGIPAGCKIHSGVYSVTPRAAGCVVELMLKKELVSFTEADVMDIDESFFRQGVVKAKRYGEMQVPSELRYIQATKSGGKESDELVLQDIAEYLIDQMDDELFIMGSGSTVAYVMEQLELENTLLGVDLVCDRDLMASDVTEEQLFLQVSAAIASGQPVKLIITLIGGQGHILGRGNQQLSPRIINLVGKENIFIVATKTKLSALNNRPLIVDSGDSTVNALLSGYMPVTTGYNDQVLYPVASPGSD